MTRKDYRAIAEVIRNTRRFHTIGANDPTRSALVSEVCRDIARSLLPILRADNPRFDAGRFLEACEDARR
jgi:hypothetical protein